MPEGPSIVILKETLQPFAGKKVLKATGNAKIDMKRMVNRKIIRLESHGKHFLVCFKDFYLRIHLLMFGTYRVNKRKELPPRLRLEFAKSEFSFYTCSITLNEGKPEDHYDWAFDLMSAQWKAAKTEKKLKEKKPMNICDALLDQEVFAGLGNIIKNEVLFRQQIHPRSTTKGLPEKKLKALIKDAQVYSHKFYEWKKAFTLKEHWQIHTKKECPRCKIKTEKEYIGKTKRRTFFCNNCQELYK